MTQNMFGNKSIGEAEWKPHNWNVETNPNTEILTTRVPGPDWTSKLRYIEPAVPSTEVSTTDKEAGKPDVKRRFPWRNQQSTEEWTFYWDGSKVGKQCLINGEVKGNLQTTREIFVEDTMGSRRKVSDPRDGTPCRSPGDKSYPVPEYSKDFYKEGSTLPAVNFGRSTDVVAETFIPLQPLPKQKSLTYLEKEGDRMLQEEKQEVEALNDWTPAPTIAPGL